MTLFLFLIITLHTLTLGCFQSAHSIVTQQFAHHPILYRVILYSTAILVSLLHQPISKLIGLKMELAGGGLCSALGMLLFVVRSRLLSSSDWIMILAMILMGIAMLSVINCLITYVVLVFNNKTIQGIIALLAFGNAGLMLAPLLLRLGVYLHMTTELFFFLITLLLMYVAGILILFDEPSHSAEAESYSGAYLRRSMPLRLSLYILAIGCYGLIESTFSLWGGELLVHKFAVLTSEKAVSLFWLSMVLGQALLLILLRRFNARRIYLLTAANILIALFCIPQLPSYPLILAALMVGGLGCSFIFPTTLSFLEREIFLLSQDDRHLYLPMIEHAISWMTAGYLFGVGLNDIMTDWSDNSPGLFFLIALSYLLVYTGLITYLNKTRKSTEPPCRDIH